VNTLHETWKATGRGITIVVTHVAPGRFMVHAERLGGLQATRLLDFHGATLMFRKALAYQEARQRWGAPGRISFTTVVRHRGPMAR